ncbi:PH domain-like [Trinorchestia longiramus]|nr:PH domain-like [Trinorchestia longiramus]
MDEKLRQPHQGHLVKFTNVVKGWQTRWFVLNPELGTLHYYLSEHDLPSRARGSIQLAGAVISPSDEDCQTFTVSPACGEAYKLRAQDSKDRQMWLNRLRVIAEMHTRAIAHHHSAFPSHERRGGGGSSSSSSLPSAPSTKQGIYSQTGHPHLNSASHSAQGVGTQVTGGGGGGGGGEGGGLAVLDAFTQVSELLQSAHRQHSNLAAAVEDLPAYGGGLKCSEPQLLLLKATSQATVLCLEGCLSVLQQQQQLQLHQQYSRRCACWVCLVVGFDTLPALLGAVWLRAQRLGAQQHNTGRRLLTAHPLN